MRSLTSKRVALGQGLLAACLVAAPWTGVAGAAVVPVGEWNTMKSTVEGDNVLTYKFSVPADQPLTITWQFHTSGYTPTPSQPGFISEGEIVVNRSNSTNWEAGATFDMTKPMDAVFVPGHTNLRLTGNGSDLSTARQGPYIPGELYSGTMVWDRNTDTIDITVAWSGGQYSRNVPSSNLEVTDLNFYNPGMAWEGIGWSSFGNLQVTVPEPATIGMFAVGSAGLLLRRRKSN